MPDMEVNDVVINGELIIMFSTNNLELLNKMTKDRRWDYTSMFGEIISYKTHDISAIIEFLKGGIKHG